MQICCLKCLFLHMHGLSFKTSVSCWQDQPGCGYPCNFTLLCVLNQVNELYADLLFKMLIPTHAWLKLQNKCILLARSTRLPINRNLKSLGVSTLFFFYPASIFFSTQSCYDILHTASGFTR